MDDFKINIENNNLFNNNFFENNYKITPINSLSTSDPINLNLNTNYINKYDEVFDLDDLFETDISIDDDLNCDENDYLQLDNDIENNLDDFPYKNNDFVIDYSNNSPLLLENNNKNKEELSYDDFDLKEWSLVKTNELNEIINNNKKIEELEKKNLEYEKMFKKINNKIDNNKDEINSIYDEIDSLSSKIEQLLFLVKPSMKLFFKKCFSC